MHRHDCSHCSCNSFSSRKYKETSSVQVRDDGSTVRIVSVEPIYDNGDYAVMGIIFVLFMVLTIKFFWD